VESLSTRTISERRAKWNRYRRKHRTRNLLARATADPSFVLSRINTNLPITRIFLNSIQENTRDAPYLSPGTLPSSYSPIYEVEPDSIEVYLPSDPQLPSPPPSPRNEPPPDSPPPSPLNEPSLDSPLPFSLLFLLRFIPQSILAIDASRDSLASFSPSTLVQSFQVALP